MDGYCGMTFRIFTDPGIFKQITGFWISGSEFLFAKTEFDNEYYGNDIANATKKGVM